MKNTNTLSKDRLKKIVMNYAIYLILLIVVGVIVAVDPSFLQIGNLSYICTQASTRLILSLGVAGIIVLRAILTILIHWEIKNDEGEKMAGG